MTCYVSFLRAVELVKEVTPGDTVTQRKHQLNVLSDSCTSSLLTTVISTVVLLLRPYSS